MAWGHQKPSDAIQDWIDEYKVPNSAFPFIKICQWAKHCQSKLELFQTQCKHQKFWAQNSKSSYVLAKSGDTGTMKRLAGLPLPRWEAFDNCIFYNMCSSIYLRMNCMPFVLMIPVVHSSHTLRKMLTHWFSGVQMIRIVWSMASETLGNCLGQVKQDWLCKGQGLKAGIQGLVDLVKKTVESLNIVDGFDAIFDYLSNCFILTRKHVTWNELKMAFLL